MTTTLSYQRRIPPRPSRLVSRLAHCTLLYPLITLGALYGEWLSAWLALGRMPVTFMDDPKYVLGGVLHLFTAIVLLGVSPAALAGAVLNLMWVIDYRRFALVGAARLLLFWTTWPALFVILKWDPLTVGKWWLD